MNEHKALIYDIWCIRIQRPKSESTDVQLRTIKLCLFLYLLCVIVELSSEPQLGENIVALNIKIMLALAMRQYR